MKGNSCKINENFLCRIFGKFIVTKEASLPYIFFIVLYSLDTIYTLMFYMVHTYIFNVILR